MKKEKSTFWRNGNAMVQVWNNKTCANEATIVNKGWKDRKTNMELKKPYVFGQYSKFIKDVNRPDQYLSFYSVLRKTVKWSKEVVLYLLNYALFNKFFVYRTLNTNKKVKPKNFLHTVGRSWISKVQNRSESNSGDLHLPEKQTIPRRPTQDSPGRLW